MNFLMYLNIIVIICVILALKYYSNNNFLTPDNVRFDHLIENSNIIPEIKS